MKPSVQQNVRPASTASGVSCPKSAPANTAIDDAILTFFDARHAAEPSSEYPVPPATANTVFRLCVALSGGRDSIVLLHAMHRLVASGRLPLELSAVHVNHGISTHANAWAMFCDALCVRLDVPLTIARVEVPRDSGEGLEAAARRMRHAVFSACNADAVALAHHRDDQAETVLLNLLRGAGVAGAAGMRAERAQGDLMSAGPTLVRPLLDVPRATIETYAAEHVLDWIDDESNTDTHHRRNFLRREVLPKLEEKFPGAQKALARAAGHFAESAALLDELAAIDRQAVSAWSGRIALAGFNMLSPARARNLLRAEWVAAGFRAPDARWVEEARRQLAANVSQSETCLSTRDGALHVYRGELFVLAPGVLPPTEPVVWRGEPAIVWAGGSVRFELAIGEGVRRDLCVAGALCLKARQGGERLQIHPRRPQRSLRKLCQDAAIPPWEREQLPLLWQGENLLWVGGLGVDAAFACGEGEEGMRVVWEPAADTVAVTPPEHC